MVHDSGCKRGATRGGTAAWRVTAAAALAVWLAACGGAGPTERAPSGLPEVVDYRMGAGDRVRVTVFDQPELSGEYAVGAAGKIPVALIGQVEVDGRTPNEVQTEIASRLKGRFVANPSVQVEVVEYRPFFILGEVRQPGSYPYVNDMKVITAVAIAGGFTMRAREQDVVIVRGRDPKQYLATPETMVLPGDVIRVRERYF